MIDNPAEISREELGDRYSDALIDITNKLIDLNNRTRLGTFGLIEVKTHPFFKGLNWEKLNKRELRPPFTPVVLYILFS